MCHLVDVFDHDKRWLFALELPEIAAAEDVLVAVWGNVAKSRRNTSMIEAINRWKNSDTRTLSSEVSLLISMEYLSNMQTLDHCKLNEQKRLRLVIPRHPTSKARWQVVPN